MVEKYSIRTDLALEEKERFEEEHVEVQGVVLEEEYDEEREIRTTTVKIKTENGQRQWGNLWEHILRWRRRIWLYRMRPITEKSP